MTTLTIPQALWWAAISLITVMMIGGVLVVRALIQALIWTYDHARSLWRVAGLILALAIVAGALYGLATGAVS
jgi:hypothetical protein